MAPQWKKYLAKEWLTLVICLLVGFLLPLVLILVLDVFASGGGMKIGEGYAEFLSDLFAPKGTRSSGPGRLLATVFVLGPYAIYQFGRSIAWAVKALRTQ
jgi:hypothetical protein